MKKKILLIVIGFTLVNSTILFGQAWTIGGNNVTANSKFGTISDKNIIFISNNISRGILTRSAAWGFGTTAPNARVHINSNAGENPFRVQVNGASKLYVDNAGGVSVGSALIPPANGLFVSGSVGLGTTIPNEKLHVEGNIFVSGNINVGGGTVGVGSVETFSDGGSFTIQSNSDFVPDADNSLNLGSSTRTWASVHALTYFTTLSSSARTTAENLKAGLPEIMKLRPISYTDGSLKKFGLVEREVQSVLPEVTSDQELLSNEGGDKRLTKTATLSLEYDALIPVLIKAMQEQQKMITALQQKIAQLEATPVSSTTASDNLKTSSNLNSGVMLEQNQPNPFNQSTIIRYSLPQNALGQINLYDNNGKLLKSFNANESGQVIVNASDLKPGTYTYTLLVNSKLAATKKLIMIK